MLKGVSRVCISAVMPELETGWDSSAVLMPGPLEEVLGELGVTVAGAAPREKPQRGTSGSWRPMHIL